MSFIGWLGAMLLAYCALPQAIASFRHGHSDGLNGGFLWTWFIGEVLLLAYTIGTVGGHGPLFWNYFLNTILVGVILLFKHNPRR